MPNDTVEQSQGRMEALREMLTRRRDELAEEVEDLMRRTRAAQAAQRSEAVQDAGDLARLDDAGDRALAILQSRDRLRRQFEDALSRLAAGAYGLCEDCGGSIDETRLRAIPFAKRCLPCQEKAESVEQLEHASERKSL
jgi:DnaK suppressor protein